MSQHSRPLPLPWFKVYTEHFDRELGILSPLARGIAIGLYAHLWSSYTVRKSPRIIAAIARCTVSEVADCMEELDEFFQTTDDNEWCSVYLDEQRTLQDQERRKKSLAGKESALRKQEAKSNTCSTGVDENPTRVEKTATGVEKNPTGVQQVRVRVRVEEESSVFANAQTEDLFMSSHVEKSPFDEVIVSGVSSEEKPKRKTRQPTTVDIPECLLLTSGFSDAWAEWLEHLRAKRNNPTALAMTKQLAMLAEQPDPVAVIAQSIRNNYRGLFPLKSQNGRADKPLTGAAAIYAMLAEEEAK